MVSLTETDPFHRDPSDRWCLVHTLSRNEKRLADELDRNGVQSFLPLVRVRRRYRRSSREVQLPLFPGYLFLCGGDDDRQVALRTRRAVRVVEVADQDRIRHELADIRRTVEGDEPVDLYPGICQGRRCRVTHGSLAGLEGTVLQRRDICRVYVAVDVLGQSAQVEIEPSRIELID